MSASRAEPVPLDLIGPLAARRQRRAAGEHRLRERRRRSHCSTLRQERSGPPRRIARTAPRTYSRNVPARNIRLYLSGEETVLGHEAKRLIAALDHAGFEMSWSQIRTGGGLPAIGRGINASDGVLALVNGAWASSTYFSAEITFALGERSYEGQPALRKPCPVMAYVEEGESRFLRKHWMQIRIEAGQVTVLPSEPELAVAKISATLAPVA